MSTPSSRARSCRICSISMRPMPAKPWPPETVRTPSVDHGDVVPVGEVLHGSRQCSWDRCAAMLPSASSDSTTPHPNVASAALRSSSVTSWSGIAELHRDREVQPGRTTTQAQNPHRIAPHAPRSNTAGPVCHRRRKYFKLEIFVGRSRAPECEDLDVAERNWAGNVEYRAATVGSAHDRGRTARAGRAIATRPRAWVAGTRSTRSPTPNR